VCGSFVVLFGAEKMCAPTTSQKKSSHERQRQRHDTPWRNESGTRENENENFVANKNKNQIKKIKKAKRAAQPAQDNESVYVSVRFLNSCLKHRNTRNRSRDVFSLKKKSSVDSLP
jgi:hypothetical protein